MTSAAGLARVLNERGVPTSRGKATWQAVQVQRLLVRLGIAKGAAQLETTAKAA